MTPSTKGSGSEITEGLVNLPIGVVDTVHDRAVGMNEVQAIAQYRAQAHIDQGRTPMVDARKRTFMVREMDAISEGLIRSKLGDSLTTAQIIGKVSGYVHVQNDLKPHTDSLDYGQREGSTNEERVKFQLDNETGFYFDPATGEFVSDMTVSLPLIDYITQAKNAKVHGWKRPMTRLQLLVLVLDIRTFDHNKRCMGFKPLTSDSGRFFSEKIWRDYNDENGVGSSAKAAQESRTGSDFSHTDLMDAFIDERAINEAAIGSVKLLPELKKKQGGGGVRRASSVDLGCVEGDNVAPFKVAITEEIFLMFATLKSGEGRRLQPHNPLKHGCGADLVEVSTVDWSLFEKWVETYAIDGDEIEEDFD